jgi:two-component system response regulator AtoC
MEEVDSETGDPRVLLAEDDPVFAQLLAAMIERYGFSVTVAHSVSQARGDLDEGAFAAIVLDFEFPDGDARDLLEGLARGPHRDTPVFIVSADADASKLLARWPVRRFFGKPVNTIALRSELHAVAHGRGAGS